LLSYLLTILNKCIIDNSNALKTDEGSSKESDAKILELNQAQEADQPIQLSVVEASSTGVTKSK